MKRCLILCAIAAAAVAVIAAPASSGAPVVKVPGVRVRGQAQRPDLPVHAARVHLP